MACAACGHEKLAHGDDMKGPCSADCDCTGYFVRGSDHCLNPACLNCAVTARPSTPSPTD